MHANQRSTLLWTQALDVVFESPSPVGKAILDRDLRYVRINSTLAEFNGRTVEQHLGLTVREVLPDAYGALEPLLLDVLAGKRHRNFRVRVETPSAPGELSEWEASYLPIPDGEGGVLGVYVQAVNLTLRMRAERALAETEKQLRRVLDSLFAFVGVLTPEGILIEANKAPLDAAGIAAHDVLGRPFWATYWWSYSEELQDWLQQACLQASRGEVIRQDVLVRMAGDTRMMIDFMLAPMRNDDGQITHLIASAIDVSERMAYQQRIESALQERTLLLQEIHHRVKNNLQIIASLLRLQSRLVSPAVAQALQDSQNRVMAMSLTHQLLYERNDFSALELGPYLKRLAASLRDSHSGLLERVKILVEAPDQGIRVDPQQAVPIALAVNELLTNALKHAFPDSRTGQIQVCASQDEHDLTVRVSDDGVGLPMGTDLHSSPGLGFSLIRLLAEQLRAELTFPSAGEPARFTLRIPISSSGAN